MAINEWNIEVTWLLGALLTAFLLAASAVWLRYFRHKRLLQAIGGDLSNAEFVAEKRFGADELPWTVGHQLPSDFDSSLWGKA